MNKVIDEIYSSGSVVSRNGTVHKLHSEVDREEGKFLYDVIKSESTVVKTLEVGCAYGLSSLHITAATKDREGCAHTIVDPFQNSQWDGIGVSNLEKAGIDFYELHELKSEFALPQILKDNEGTYDFIFVDGWHTFDHTLIDCFYATRLLKVGGLLAIDDITYPSITQVADFLLSYPCYKQHAIVSKKVGFSWKRSLTRLATFPFSKKLLEKTLSRQIYRKIYEYEQTRMIVLKKTEEDERSWDWHDA